MLHRSRMESVYRADQLLTSPTSPGKLLTPKSSTLSPLIEQPPFSHITFQAAPSSFSLHRTSSRLVHNQNLTQTQLNLDGTHYYFTTMSKIFITGSSDGLGSLAAKALTKKGHKVTLHARNAQRAKDAQKLCPEASNVLVADLSSVEATKKLASELNELGPWDAIIHNAGVMHGVSGSKGPEGLPVLFATNTLAPYLLTCLVSPPPKRVAFLSSQLHQGGDATLKDIQGASYSDSKLHNTIMAFAFAKKMEGCGTLVNSLDPGWVKTKMGGSGASDDIEAAVETYVLLGEGKGKAEGVTGKHWYHDGFRGCRKEAGDEAVQEKLLGKLAEISGVKVPEFK